VSRGTDQRLSGFRVLAFCDYFAAGSSGGAERVSYEVYERLARWGAEITVLTTTPPGPSPQLETIDGVRVVRVPALDLSRLTGAQSSIAPRALPRAFRLAEEWSSHVLHANSLHFQTSISAAMVARRRRVPLVTTAHLAHLRHLPRLTGIAARAYEETAGRFILGSSTRVIAVSRGVVAHLRSLGVPREKIDLIFNGVDHDLFKPADDAGTHTPVVLFVGRLIANKGPDVLIRAAELLTREGVTLEVVFVGDGPLRSRLEAGVERRRMGDRVKFIGHSSDVAGWLRRAAVFVRPSLTEGLPLTVLEAMASGVCVVASNVPGNNELIEHGVNGLLVTPDDPRSLAQALRSVLVGEERRARLAESGYLSSRTYSWDACAEGVARTLLEVAGARHRWT
jgi:glycosyltransferase involved in cell wall biosynthesis